MSAAAAAGTWRLGDLEVNRVGYGALRLTEEEPALLDEPCAPGV